MNSLNVYKLKEPEDPKANPGIILSMGPDDLSCQAEIVAFYRRYADAPNAPKGGIFGFYAVDKGYTREKWINLLTEAERLRIMEAKADVEAKGFTAFHKGMTSLKATGERMIQVIARPQVADQFRSKGIMPMGFDSQIKDVKEELKEKIRGASYEAQEALANPLHAGVHPDFPATVTDEAWITTSNISIKTIGAEKWLRMVVDTLRSYFGGRPKQVVPHKNERCTCQSGKKYGKCCGMGVQEDDPEDCKLGLHEFGSWSKAGAGKFIRGCERCLKIEEAPYGEDVTLKSGAKIALIGCRACTKAPTPQDAEAVFEAWSTWFRCAACDKPIGLKEAVCSHHVKSDGTHNAEWKFTSVSSTDDVEEIRYSGAEQEMLALLHKDCLGKAIPYRETYGSMTAMKGKDGFLVQRKPPKETV